MPSFKYPSLSNDDLIISMAITKNVESIMPRQIVASHGTVGYRPNNFSVLNITVAHIHALTKIISPHLNTIDKYTSIAVFFIFIITCLLKFI